MMKTIRLESPKNVNGGILCPKFTLTKLVKKASFNDEDDFDQ